MSRTETYEKRKPDGSIAVVTRDIDTGEKSVKIKGETSKEPADKKVDDPKGDASKGQRSDDGKGAPERPSRGASLAAWAEFAKAVGFEHDEKASRDEIRDAYEAAHPAE